MLRWRGSPWMLGCVIGAVGAQAWAQEIDLTYTQPPVVMLAIDTSGSMQFSGERPERDDKASPQLKCALGSTERSREVVVKEVLTGTFNGYSLTQNAANPNGAIVSECAGGGQYTASKTSQNSDGLLDTYAERLRFAFSTFDNTETFKNQSGDYSYPGTTNPVATDGYFYNPSGSSITGCTSCGTCGCPSGGATCLTFPAGAGGNAFTRSYCAGNVGIKSLAGAPCSGNGCLLSAGAVGSSLATQNATIQSQILAIVSSGGTPIAGMLKDLRYWFDNHPDVKVDANSSNFLKCRKNYVLLVTDGVPNLECGHSALSSIRPEVCDPQATCTGDSGCPGTLLPSGAREWTCKSVAGQSSKYCVSAYQLEVAQASSQQAANLFNPAAGKTSVTVHTVGFDFGQGVVCTGASDCPYSQVCTTVPSSGLKRCSCVDDTQCVVGASCEADATGFRTCHLGGALRAIAAAGGGQALFANDPTSLRTAINQIFSQLLPESTSRTRVTSTAGVAPLAQLPTNFPQTNAAALFLFQSAFTVPGSSIYWQGFLQRVSIGNVGTVGSPIIGPITQGAGLHGTVRFDELLNTQPRPVDDQGTAYDRKLYTYKNGAVVAFTTANITPADLGAASTAERDSIVNFIRGEVGSARAANRLGAIYHASPVVLEPPMLDLALPSYQTFKQDTAIRNRPPIVFAGSNLGMLHAFNGMTGREEWAFIPPALLLTLKSQLTAFTYGVDATPVARDIQLTSLNASNDRLANWRSVVVAPLGQGGSAVVALEVTQPVYSGANEPPFKFLWQFDQTRTYPTNRLGTPFASPTVGTVFLDDPTAGYPFQERAVVIIPGGKTPSGGVAGQGEDVWVVDLSTGALLKRFAGYSGSGGMTGNCAALDDFPGSFLTRVFCGDNSGRLLRLALAGPLISGWTSEASWYDLYGTGGTRLPIYAAPALANRSNGNLMLLFGAGDPSDLDGTTESRMAFVEETPVVDPTSGLTTGFTATLRKLVPLSGGEKLTGSPVIYNSVAYWSTFVPDTSSSCSFGRTRLWGAQFDQFTPEVAGRPNALTDALIPRLDSQCGPDSVIDTDDDVQGTTTSCLLPSGSVSFGFDVVRTPAVTVTGTVGGGTGGTGGAGNSTTVGGSLKLVFQTGTGLISQTSKLRDPELTPPGSQRIQVGAINVTSSQAAARVISWGKVAQ